MKNRKNLLTLTLLVLVTAGLNVSPVEARGARGDRGGSDDFGVEYCRYYKTKAMYASQKARANNGVAKYGRRANALWRKYNACRKDFGRQRISPR